MILLHFSFFSLPYAFPIRSMITEDDRSSVKKQRDVELFRGLHLVHLGLKYSVRTSSYMASVEAQLTGPEALPNFVLLGVLIIGLLRSLISTLIHLLVVSLHILGSFVLLRRACGKDLGLRTFCVAPALVF